jgi:hypothetical protein
MAEGAANTRLTNALLVGEVIILQNPYATKEARRRAKKVLAAADPEQTKQVVTKEDLAILKEALTTQKGD